MKDSPLAISPKTQALIECLDSANKLWEQVSNALGETYEDSMVAQLMTESYSESHYRLKEAIGKLVVQSIESNIGLIDFKEI